jgi:C-terminal processing protease CtpA/Prc
MKNVVFSVFRGCRMIGLGSGFLVLLISPRLEAAGEQGPANPSLEEGKVGSVPAGWFLPGPCRDAGYTAELTEEQPQQGKRSALLRRDAAKGPAPAFGNLMQNIDAAPFRGRRIRFRAAVRAEVKGAGNQAQLWLRVDRKSGQVGFFENMGDRPITERGWCDYEIVGGVAEDAQGIALGLMLLGNGRVWLDDVRLEVLGALNEGNQPPRPLQGRGLDNLAAFTRLLGYVRYFHPSDQAAAQNWEQFAISGVQAVENATDPEALADVLRRLFNPIVPSVRVFLTADLAANPGTGQSEKVETKKGQVKPVEGKVVFWRHVGVGLGRSPVYSSSRVDPGSAQPAFGPKLPEASLPDPQKPYAADLGGGVSCQVPIAVYRDEKGTLPRPEVNSPAQARGKAAPSGTPRPVGFQPSGNDRATRLAAVAIAWNVFQHFYPYFDVVEVDWPGELRRALTRAAEDSNERAFLKTLRRMVAALRDGHGGVYLPSATGAASFPPFGWDWVEDHLVITGIADQGGNPSGLKRGDLVTKIDGVAVPEVITAQETEISGATPASRRKGALVAVAGGPPGSEIMLKIRPGPMQRSSDAGGERTVRVRRTLDGAHFLTLREPRPDKISTIQPGVIYVDLSRINQQDFDNLAPRLAEAGGIVFDLRGYPQAVSPQTIGHLSDHVVTSARWQIPVTFWPDREKVVFSFSNWSVQPQRPRFKGKVAFMTDARAISYAETYLAIIEHYKLADIVGAPTAGTNGNVNPFVLPGGYQVSWTGMKVLKHDGSRHHGVGVWPTVPATRTIRGIAAGRDEVLERALEVVKAEP